LIFDPSTSRIIVVGRRREDDAPVHGASFKELLAPLLFAVAGVATNYSKYNETSDNLYRYTTTAHNKPIGETTCRCYYWNNIDSRRDSD
jgi:hypothetical protein